MKNITNFQHFQTDNQIDLYVCKNPKFKTNLIQFVLINPLDIETVSKNALVPYIIYRGSERYPSSKDFKIHLDELYGAELTVSVWKRGENQIINFAMEIVNEKYLPTDEPLLEYGLDLLKELILSPLFTIEFFEQEREYIIKEIKSLINDKYSYSLSRCYQEMCSDEPYGLHKLGRIEDHQKLTHHQVIDQYKKIIQNGRICFFVIGDVDEERVFNDINKEFSFKHKQPKAINNTIVKKEITDVNEVEERLNVQQGKLVMGFRTGTTRSDQLYYPLLIFNGILGAFPHSKLFQNVREKSSLAYYANSNIESTKGLLIITSGIEFANYKKARDIITEQVEKISNGDITEDEIEWTRKSIVSQFMSSADNIKAISGHYLLGLLNEHPETIADSIKNIKKVNREEIIKVGQKIELDTVYFLNKKVDE